MYLEWSAAYRLASATTHPELQFDEVYFFCLQVCKGVERCGKVWKSMLRSCHRLKQGHVGGFMGESVLQAQREA